VRSYTLTTKDARVHCAVLKQHPGHPQATHHQHPTHPGSCDEPMDPATKTTPPPANASSVFPQDPTVHRTPPSPTPPTRTTPRQTHNPGRTCQRSTHEPTPRRTHAYDRGHTLQPTNNHKRCELLRKEVIQPHLPVRLPCYDFVPIADPTFDSSLSHELGHRLRVLPTFVT